MRCRSTSVRLDAVAALVAVAAALGGCGGCSSEHSFGSFVATDGVATVDGRNGSYYVMAGEPHHYRATGVGMDTQASTYSVADNGTGTSSG